MHHRTIQVISNHPKFFKSAILAISLLLSFNACTNRPVTLEDRNKMCSENFSKANDFYKNGKYGRSREVIYQIMQNCTGSGFMEESQFLLAENNFYLKDWISARGEYSIYLSHYPNSSHAEIASYRLGLSTWKIPYVAGRDEAYTDMGIRNFVQFIEDFPESSKLDSAHWYLEDLDRRRAEKDFAIGRLYFRMGESLAAAISLKDFIAAHPNSPLVNKARLMLAESYTRIEQFQQAEDFIQQLEAQKDFDSPSAIHKARKNLAKAVAKAELRVEKGRKERIERIEDES